MQHLISRRSLSRGAAVGAALLVTGLFAGPAAARLPKGLNTALDRVSEKGAFRVTVRSEALPIPLWRVHQWNVRITDGAGAPVDRAMVLVDGGMPQHHHGLPTKPRATPSATPGEYVISGMKFSMPGWWELKLGVTSPDGRTDRITFNIVL